VVGSTSPVPLVTFRTISLATGTRPTTLLPDYFEPPGTNQQSERPVHDGRADTRQFSTEVG
jgi:hypothetical protein